MWDIEKEADILAALGHPTRLARALTKGENYLSDIAKNVGISRALAKVHLKKLREAGLVESRVLVMEDEARALRFYKINDFEVNISPDRLAEEVKKENE